MADGKTSFWKTFFESGKILFSDYRLFVPSLIMMFLSAAISISSFYSDFFKYTISQQTPTVPVIIGFVFAIIVMIIVNMIISGWEFLIVKNIVSDKKFKLFSNIKGVLFVAWVLLASFFLLMIIIVLVLIALFLISAAIVGLLFLASKIAGIIVLVILIIAGVILFIPLFAYFIRLTSIILMEGKGPVNSIVLSWKYFIKNFKNSLLVFLVSLAVIIPLIILQMSFMALTIGTNSLLIFQNPLKYQLIMLPISVISLIVSVWFLVFYAKCYRKNM
jgi:hypothetical protein